MKGDAIHWKKTEESCQNRTTSSLVNVSEASKASWASSSGTKNGRVICEGRTEGVVIGHVRSSSSRSGQVLCWSRTVEYRFKCSSRQWHWYYASMLGALSCLPMMNEGRFVLMEKGILCVQNMGRNYCSRVDRCMILHITNGWLLRSWGEPRLGGHTNLDQARKGCVCVNVGIVVAVIEGVFVSNLQAN